MQGDVGTVGSETTLAPPPVEFVHPAGAVLFFHVRGKTVPTFIREEAKFFAYSFASRATKRCLLPHRYGDISLGIKPHPLGWEDGVYRRRHFTHARDS